MSNEELVANIQQGENVQENLLLLYNRNMPLIKSFCLKHAGNEPLEDLLQVAFMSLYDSTQHYNAEKGCKYITYCLMWVKQAVYQYLTNCGNTIKLPNEYVCLISKYKRFLNSFFIENGKNPTDEEICQALKIENDLLKLVKIHSMNIKSLDEEIGTETDNFSLIEMIASDEDIESDCIGRTYNEFEKSKLWDIVDKNLLTVQAEVLKDRYLNNKTYNQIAAEKGFSFQRARQIEYEALRKLKIKRNQFEQLELPSSIYFKGGLRKFKEKDYTSCVESIVFRKLDAERNYIKSLLNCKKRFSSGIERMIN